MCKNYLKDKISEFFIGKELCNNLNLFEDLSIIYDNIFAY